MRRAYQAAILLSTAMIPPVAAAAPLTVIAIPPAPFIELRRDHQMVQADLLVRNNTGAQLTLAALKLRVFDNHDRLVLMRELDPNGKPPAIDMMNARALPPHSTVDFFLPFTRFDGAARLHRLHIDLLFMRAGHAPLPVPFSADQVASIDLLPRAYTAPLQCLPLRGSLLVFDGHDEFSHHRRHDLAPTFVVAPDEALNRNLYAWDFVVIDAGGQLFHGSPAGKADWFTYGAAVHAPAAGKVVSAANSEPENSFAPDGSERDAPPSGTDPHGMGNHIAIAYTGGGVGWLLHLQPGSVTVRAGQAVRAGQVVGRVGFSGDSLFPHLHYNVTNSSQFWSQGVPAYFRGIQRGAGASGDPAGNGQLDTGDLAMALPSGCVD
jgi:hypothetical protein